MENLSRPGAMVRWTAPSLIAIALHWSGTTAWFQKDDFVWLNLRNLLAQGKSIWWILFQPLSQGTIRTLSERLYFLTFYKWFGLNALPYHLLGLATFCASLVVLQSVTENLTGSRWAGFWAAIFWAVNASVSIPLAWVCQYYEILCAFFLLSSVWLLLRYLETNDNRYYAAQVATFLLGFFALELNVVYPAIALGIVLVRAPKLAWKIVWLFPVSLIYAAIHTMVAPLQSSGPYQMFWDWHVLPTLATYTNWALGTGWLRLLNLNSFALRVALAAPVLCGLAIFLIAKIREKNWIALVGPAWFVIVLAPLLPLRNHMSMEYLTVPAIGLAIFGGWAAVSGWRAASVALTAIYLGASIPVGLALTAQYHDRSERLRTIYEAAVRAHDANPMDILIFRNVNQETFYDLLYHHAFRVAGFDAYAAAEEKSKIDWSEAPFGAEIFLAPDVERNALAQRRAMVFDASTLGVVQEGR